jgi:hypothetical protein
LILKAVENRPGHDFAQFIWAITHSGVFGCGYFRLSFGRRRSRRGVSHGEYFFEPAGGGDAEVVPRVPERGVLGVVKRVVVACVLALALAGCDTLATDNPIGTTKQTQTDPRLIGQWSLETGKSGGSRNVRAYGFFLPRVEGGYHVVLVGWGTKASDSGTTEFDAVTGVAGGSWFLNTQNYLHDGKPDEKQPAGYQPLSYRFDSDGTLNVSRWSDAGLHKLQEAIEKGEIAGDVTISISGSGTGGQPIKSIHVHISAEKHAQDAFFATHAAEIFSLPVAVLRRPDAHDGLETK